MNPGFFLHSPTAAQEPHSECVSSRALTAAIETSQTKSLVFILISLDLLVEKKKEQEQEQAPPPSGMAPKIRYEFVLYDQD